MAITCVYGTETAKFVTRYSMGVLAVLTANSSKSKSDLILDAALRSENLLRELSSKLVRLPS
jgi:hypothetical protein